jgi:acyl carrier protein
VNQQPAAPTYAATLATMRAVLAKRFGIELYHLDEDAELATLGFDSLGFIEYVFELESALHITLPDVPQNVQKVGEFARYVHGEVVKQFAQPPK